MGDKTIPEKARRVWNNFIPHESQVSIYHNQGVVFFFVSFIDKKEIF